MDNQNNSINSRKNKHLNFKERTIIEIRLGDGNSPYKIAKELKRPINTILNEIRRGTTVQIKQFQSVTMYLTDTGEAIYQNNRRNSCCKFKRLKCSKFISYDVDKIKSKTYSLDACVGETIKDNKFERHEMVCTKTLYNYIDLGLLEI